MLRSSLPSFGWLSPRFRQSFGLCQKALFEAPKRRALAFLSLTCPLTGMALGSACLCADGGRRALGSRLGRVVVSAALHRFSLAGIVGEPLEAPIWADFLEPRLYFPISLFQPFWRRCSACAATTATGGPAVAGDGRSSGGCRYELSSLDDGVTVRDVHACGRLATIAITA